MSLTSYRAAPPRVGVSWVWSCRGLCGGVFPGREAAPAGRSPRVWVDWKTWRRPTLPCLEAQYHGRWGFSRPSSGWDRVRAPRHDHQVVQSTHLRGPVPGRGRGGLPWGAARGGSGGSGAVCVSCRCGVAVDHPGICDLGMISVHGVGGGYRAARAIRTGQLRALPRLHIRPINVMVCHGPVGVAPGEIWF
jgi:hypothetical protein